MCIPNNYLDFSTKYVVYISLGYGFSFKEQPRKFTQYTGTGPTVSFGDTESVMCDVIKIRLK